MKDSHFSSGADIYCPDGDKCSTGGPDPVHSAVVDPRVALAAGLEPAPGVRHPLVTLVLT